MSTTATVIRSSNINSSSCGWWSTSTNRRSTKNKFEVGSATAAVVFSAVCKTALIACRGSLVVLGI